MSRCTKADLGRIELRVDPPKAGKSVYYDVAYQNVYSLKSVILTWTSYFGVLPRTTRLRIYVSITTVRTV